MQKYGRKDAPVMPEIETTITLSPQEWLNLILGIGGVTFFGYVLLQIRSNAAARVEAIGEQLRNKQTEIDILRSQLAERDEQLRTRDERTALAREKHEKEANDLRSALNLAQEQVRAVLPQGLANSAMQPPASKPYDNLAIIQQAGKQMQEALQAYLAIEPRLSSEIAEWRETIAATALATRDFDGAARQLDDPALSQSLDWETHFARGVAKANSRDGHRSNQAALQAYSEAIALMPDNISPEVRARLFIYRGAMLKRLNRLDEAHADLSLALKAPVTEDNRLDAHYNLAGVEALRDNKAEAMSHIRAVASDDRFLDAVAHNRDVYFSNLAAMPEFEVLIARTHKIHGHQRLPLPDS